MKLARAISKDGRVYEPGAGGAFALTGSIKAVAPPRAVKSIGAHAAALVTRLNEDWPIQILSADAANRWSLRQLRARSRHLERNGSIVTAYLDALECDIIGHRGIGLHMKVQDAGDDRVIPPAEHDFYQTLNAGLKAYRTGDPRLRQQYRQIASESQDSSESALKGQIIKTARALGPDDQAIPGGETDRYACYLGEREYKEFAKKGNCDVTRKHSLMDLCRLAVRTAARDGDALILCYLGYANRWGLGLRILEGDYLDDAYNVERLPNGNRIRMSIEVDPYGAKVAVWAFAQHPGDFYAGGVEVYGPRMRIPIIDNSRGEIPEPDPYFDGGRTPSVVAIHVTRSKRGEETRAVPWISHVMEIIRHIEVLKEAEITAARAEACKHKVYTRDLYSSDGTELDWSEDPDGQLHEEMAPAESEVLPPGYTVQLIDPKHPNPHFPDFLKSMKREVASGLMYCYNLLFGDLESVNYSSLRGGLLLQREGSKMGQAWFDQDVFTIIIGLWLKMSLLSRALPFGLTAFDRLNHYESKYRRWDWVDPKNDAETAQLLLELKVTTRGKIISDRTGEDFEATADELDDEEAYLATKKNILAADARQAALDNPAPPPRPADPISSSVKGWITTEEGNHVYIDDAGAIHGGRAAIAAAANTLTPKFDDALQGHFAATQSATLRTTARGGNTPESHRAAEDAHRSASKFYGEHGMHGSAEAHSRHAKYHALRAEGASERIASTAAYPKNDSGVKRPTLTMADITDMMSKGATKSAFLGDVPLGDLPDHVQDTIGDFIDADPADVVTRYQMTVPELLDKADPANLRTAQRRLRNRTNASCAAEVDERKDKHILLLNDRIIDGHHHLAKAEKGKITRSLPVLDLSPLRHQVTPPVQKKSSSVKSNPNHDPANGRFAADMGGGFGGSSDLVSRATADYRALAGQAEKVLPEFSAKLQELADLHGAEVKLAPIKGEARAVAKIVSDYQGDSSRIKDLVRGTLVARDPAHAHAIAEHILAHLETSGARNLWAPGSEGMPGTGYRDAKFNVPLGGMLTEIQVSTPAMLAAKKEAHPIMANVSKIERDAANEKRDLRPEEIEAIEGLNARQREIYGRVPV